MRVLVVSAGRGPAEVRQFVADLQPALTDLLAQRGLAVTDTEVQSGSVRLWVRGPGRVDDLVGTHVLVDPARGRRARQRWFVGVSVHPVQVTRGPLRPSDVVVTATRAGGPGGQHVNTTASAVRATHRPTGLSVRVATERSQHANRRLALARLQLQLTERDAHEAEQAQQAQWRSHDAVTRGNPVATWRRTKRGLTCERTSSRS